MYLDKMLEFSDAEVFASETSGTETVSTDIVDLEVSETDAFGTTITPDIGDAGMLIWHLRVQVALVGSSATLVCELVTKTVATSMDSGSTILATQIIPALAAAGTKYQIPVPMGSCLRYLAVLYRAVGATLTSATIDSFISLDRQNID